MLPEADPVFVEPIRTARSVVVALEQPARTTIGTDIGVDGDMSMLRVGRAGAVTGVGARDWRRLLSPSEDRGRVARIVTRVRERPGRRRGRSRSRGEDWRPAAGQVSGVDRPGNHRRE